MRGADAAGDAAAVRGASDETAHVPLQRESGAGLAFCGALGVDCATVTAQFEGARGLGACGNDFFLSLSFFPFFFFK